MPTSAAAPPVAYPLGEFFWENADLTTLTTEQWEALCDGCGRCCLHKLEDEDSGELFYTNVACRLLDLDTGRCTHYAQRWDWVPDCLALTPAVVQEINWLPSTCAYRLLAQGQTLPPWHPLRTGDAQSTQRAGMSVCGWALSESKVRRLEYHIIEAL